MGVAVIDFEKVRTIPLRRPEGFVPPVKRYSISWRRPVQSIVTGYFGIQSASKDIIDSGGFQRPLLEAFGEGKSLPASVESSFFIDSRGCYNLIYVAYWLDWGTYEKWASARPFRGWWTAKERQTEGVGYWREILRVSPERMETLYAYPDYKVGVARCDPSEFSLVEYNGYFGAMRDRIAVSAVDRLEPPLGSEVAEARLRDTYRRRVLVHVPHNLVAIRSGQYWEKCGEEQRTDYFLNMRPLLERGTEHLRSNPRESGCLAMRLTRNLEISGRERDESFNHAYFQSLEHLEAWSASHKTHLAIWGHAIAMMKKYGESRELRTWHEVYVLPEGGQVFEYVNCHPETGLLPYFDAECIS